VTIHQIDPVRDPRWAGLLQRHPRASVFHTPEWLAALKQTYGYEPHALAAATPDGELYAAVVVCRIKSWLTGSRTVSLPFSDHCEPLVETGEELQVLLGALKRELHSGKGKYLEIRPVSMAAETSMRLSLAASFCLHRLDLRPSIDEIFRRFHRDCVQRKIRRAERESLSYEEGNSEPLLAAFYSLLGLTRRRQGSAPQPIAWFRNLIASMGAKLKIRVVSSNGRPVASILTLAYKDTLVYKYGCSDKEFSKLGGTPLLFWKAIQDAKNEGLCQFDLGRSDWDDTGLIVFKDRWGATRSELNYWRLPGSRRSASAVPAARAEWKSRTARQVLPPDTVVRSAGTLLYRHMG
jgi:CelD/BcsL family acetyltransferase involved in cellulose biosynthesis